MIHAESRRFDFYSGQYTRKSVHACKVEKEKRWYDENNVGVREHRSPAR